jgi:hypothetical protein
MKAESAKRVVDAYFDVFDQLNLKTFNQGMSFVLQNLEDKLRTLRPLRSRDALMARLVKEPEPEPLELDAQLEAIRLLPYTIRKGMPEAMREFSQVLPHDPGGRPRVLTDKESKYVCEEIGKLIAMGVRLLVAQDRLALRMSQKKSKDVSVRSIQRAWQDRAKWFETDRKNSTSIGGRIMNRLRRHEASE